MSAAQLTFLALFTVVLAGVLGFSVVVLRDAVRSGALISSPGVLYRMTRRPAERGELHRWAFIAHRLSGFAVFAFLCLHVIDIGLAAVSSSLYDDFHAIYGTVPMRLFECALLVAILFHTFNGLRLIVIDIADLGSAAALKVLYAVTVLTGLLGIAGTVVILKPVLS